jgi:hypothetical protein
MADRNHQHNKTIVLYESHNPVISNSISPESLAVSDQGVPESPRVGTSGNTLPQILQHAPLRLVT